MALANFLWGTSKDIENAPFQEGNIYFLTDTQEIYADIPENLRQSYSGKQGENSSPELPNIDYDDIYAYVLKKMLSDPAAIFQGATATADSLPGLVPPLPNS